jgi:hypothetical protein
MTDVRQKRLEEYETSAARCEMLAWQTTDRTKQLGYEQLAAHYRNLAASFREALAVYDAALAKLTVH